MVTATLYDEWARNGCNSNLCTVRRWTYNLAVVVFEKPIGTELGFFGLAASDSFSIYATIAGFPEDKPSGEMVGLDVLLIRQPYICACGVLWAHSSSAYWCTGIIATDAPCFHIDIKCFQIVLLVVRM